jgi:hypothetical protein
MSLQTFAVDSGISVSYVVEAKEEGITHMKFASNAVALLLSTSLVLFAAEAMAQENTPAACADRVDNDADGYVDCADQDCTPMNF